MAGSGLVVVHITPFGPGFGVFVTRVINSVYASRALANGNGGLRFVKHMVVVASDASMDWLLLNPMMRRVGRSVRSVGS